MERTLKLLLYGLYSLWLTGMVGYAVGVEAEQYRTYMEGPAVE